MNAHLLAWLKSAGLNEQRASIYLAALARGSCQAADLAKDLGMRRTAIYDNLRVLEEGAFIQTVQQGKRKSFVALSPQDLYKRAEQQRTQLKELLPEFLALAANDVVAPTITQFQGPYAAREVFEDILRNAKKEYVYVAPQQLLSHMVTKAYMEGWVKRRVQKGIRSRSLRVRSKELRGQEMFTGEGPYLREVRFLPEYVDLKASIYIYGSNVGIISTKKEGTAAVVHSQDLAYSLKQLFEFVWSVSSK